MLHALINATYLPVKWLFFVVVISTAGSVAFAGSTDDTLKALQKEYKMQAMGSFNKGDIYQSIYFYDLFFSVGGDDLKARYKLAGLYFDTRDYKKTQQNYDSVIAKKPSKFPLSYYFNGIVSTNMEEYDKAIEYFTKFKKIYRGKRDPNDYRKLATSYIESAMWAKAHIDSFENISVSNLGKMVNSPHIDFSPFPIDDNTLIYGSLVVDTVSESSEIRKLYVAKKQNNAWRKSGILQGPVNDNLYHTGNSVVSSDGTHMYFTRSRKNWKNVAISEIYYSELIDGKWQEPVKLPYPINDENFTSTQPALAKNLRNNTDVIYFVSDRTGSKGGLDIWYAEIDKTTGEFNEPRNLGRGINTNNNECCPFYDISNSTLYFSSEGYNGFGGYDIYKAIGSGKKWTEVVSLSKPVNSSYDDTYFSTIKSGREGFFTSNRPGSFAMDNGSCCDDIFFFKHNNCTKISAGGKVTNSTNYDFYDELNKRYHLNLDYPEDNIPLANVNVQLLLKQSSQVDEIIISQQKTNDKGEYLFDLDINKDYVVLVKNYGFFDRRLNISTKNIECSDSIDIGITQINYMPEITVRFNIYYEHDKARLTSEACNTIDTTLLPVFDLFPNAIIEIGSHTDSTGTDLYNIKLSQKRSESVVNYLVSKGISIDRLVAKGYGETQPIAPNSNTDGSDNPQGRQLNRRTELRIVGELSTFYLDEFE